MSALYFSMYTHTCAHVATLVQAKLHYSMCAYTHRLTTHRDTCQKGKMKMCGFQTADFLVSQWGLWKDSFVFRAQANPLPTLSHWQHSSSLRKCVLYTEVHPKTSASLQGSVLSAPLLSEKFCQKQRSTEKWKKKGLFKTLPPACSQVLRNCVSFSQDATVLPSAIKSVNRSLGWWFSAHEW